MTRGPTRRQVAQWALHGIGASLYGAPFFGDSPISSDCERLRRVLAALFWEQPGARAMLGATPAERFKAVAPVVLMRSILGRIPLRAAVALKPAALAQIVSEQIRRDFLSNESVSVDGWILSKTEAHLYALTRGARATR